MFGYVIPDKPNILVKDYELYRAYYCGICKGIGKTTGQKSRLTLSYDITLLAMFAVAVGEETPTIKKERCPVHILKKRNVVICPDTFKTVSYINAILGYYKALDDAADEKRLLKKLGRLVIGRGYRKAKKVLPEFDELCKSQYARLSSMEKDKNFTLDAYADPFSLILEGASKIIKKDENFNRLFYNLGRYIYVLDALDDYESDIKKGRFNPLKENISTPCKNIDEAKTIADNSLNLTIEEIKRMYTSLEVNHADGPLSNIIYLGLERRKQQVLSGENKHDKRSI